MEKLREKGRERGREGKIDERGRKKRVHCSRNEIYCDMKCK